MIKNIFILKTACLLHDPPNKAWLIRDDRDHKEEARYIATNVLENTCLKEAIERMEEITKPADMLASSVDRWLLSKLIGKEYGKFRENEIKLKNIFNPKFSQKIEQEQTPTKEFIEALKKVIEHILDPQLAYHVLYASYETTWIQLGLPVSPADTRAPSHSIFDHNYATASMMNWLLENEEPKGILLYIDLGGVQKFISSSRKLRDLWLSSYLASALAWSIFWIFVRALGPDVMVLPTCRGNSFYYHSLISLLTGNGINEDVIEKIKRISNEFADYNPDIDAIPRYAVVPVTATFMLPELEQLREFNEFKEIEVEKGLESLEEFVKKKYQEVWKNVYDKVIENCKNLQSEFGNLAIEAERLLNECKKFGFDTTPPLPIRVIALHTNKLRELDFKEGRYSIYHYMFKLLSYEEHRRKLYKFRPEEDLKLFEMTSQPIVTWPKKSDRGFEYCSVCGYLPAIIIIPSDENDYKSYLKREIEPIFGMGERLCPYCLIKRFISTSKVLKSVMDGLLGKISEKLPKFRFPSVSDIALMPFKKSFINNAMKIDNIQDLTNELNGWIKEIWEKIKVKRIPLVGREPITHIERKLAESIRNLKSDELKEDLEMLLYLDAEECFLKTHIFKENGQEKYYNPRRDWLEIRKKIHKHRRIEDLNTYYAIIRCDGDNLGKIIHGKVEDGFRITIKDYLCNLLEGSAKEVVKAIVNNDIEKAKKICEENNVKEIDEKIKEISNIIIKLQDKNEIIISPSYHSTLSKALMASAIRDSKIIDEHDGLTIYVGGDDLLAITPVKDSLHAVQELREKFSFPSERYKGFYQISKYLIPSLVTASRSFSIYLTHYMFPLYTAISRSAELLDEIAKESKWMIDSETRKKDAIVLLYSPKGGECYSLLPLSDIKTPDQNLAKSLKHIDELILEIEKNNFSLSLIYDLYNNLDTIKPLVNRNNGVLLEKLLKRIFERNCRIQNSQKSKEMVETWTKKLMQDYDVICKIDHNELPFLEQFFLALMLYRSGLRGVE
ncbi:MAG: type III-B CRISPR-associated protein Cas10/Cmr2 [Nitrososphaerales archaeon]